MIRNVTRSKCKILDSSFTFWIIVPVFEFPANVHVDFLRLNLKSQNYCRHLKSLFPGWSVCDHWSFDAYKLIVMFETHIRVRAYTKLTKLLLNRQNEEKQNTKILTSSCMRIIFHACRRNANAHLSPKSIGMVPWYMATCTKKRENEQKEVSKTLHNSRTIQCTKSKVEKSHVELEAASPNTTTEETNIISFAFEHSYKSMHRIFLVVGLCCVSLDFVFWREKKERKCQR